MKERNPLISLEEAKELYHSRNKFLRTIALRAFREEELEPFDFTGIKTFEDVKRALSYSNTEWDLLNNTLDDLKSFSKASAAMFLLNIIRKALNKDYNLHLTDNAKGQCYTWFPYFKFITEDSTYYEDELEDGDYEKLGEFISEGITYNLIGGDVTNIASGLGDFEFCNGVGHVNSELGFLGCATEEIAKHFGKYFGMLIIEAMYGDIVDFKIVKSNNI